MTEAAARMIETTRRAWDIGGKKMSDTFLSAEEVAELSGIRTGQNGKSREELQIAWLRTSGIPFWTNARGRPIIARSAIEGASRGQAASEAPRKKWQPPTLALVG